MISPLVAILAVALVFYAIVPGVGAFGVRHRWRTFRTRVAEASLLPPVSYAMVRRSVRGAGPARFLGTLESIQGESTVWIRGTDLTLAVDMSASDLFLVARSDRGYPEGPPVRTSWNRVGSLPEGLKVLVSGTLDTTGSHPLIRSEPGRPVLAVLYDGSDATLVRRCIWSGRQLNEYWNSVTPGSLAGGVLALTVLAYFLLRQPVSPVFARLSISLATVPILPLLPPGVALFYLYRRSWRRGRALRAHRDVLRLPLRYFVHDEACANLPTGELYCKRDLTRDALSEAVSAGLTVLEPPPMLRASLQTGAGTRYTLFGRPGDEQLAPPADPLAEWVAVRADPVELSEACQRTAKRYELLALIILGVGMVANLAIVMIVVAALV
ncbi:MAG: hypothetical protein ACOC1I_06410 [Spirochaetota bacterium]